MPKLRKSLYEGFCDIATRHVLIFIRILKLSSRMEYGFNYYIVILLLFKIPRIKEILEQKYFNI